MNKNIKVLLYSLIVGVLYVGYDLLRQPYQGEGFGDIANGLGYAFIGIILIPLIFGVVTFVLSKEKRITQAFSAFGISFAVMLILMIIGGAYKNAIRKTTYPDIPLTQQQIDSANANRKTLLPY